MLRIFFIMLFLTMLVYTGKGKDHNNYYENIIEKNNVSAERKKKSIKQYRRNIEFWKNRLYPRNNYNAIKIAAELKKQNFKSSDILQSSKKWEALGPFSRDESVTPLVSGVGRVNIVKFDPVDSNVIWLGSASGGLWKSEDAGQNWQVIPFTDFMSIGIADIYVSKFDNDVIYVATGDPNSGPLFRGYSIGLIKSTDRGKSWEIKGEEYFLSENEYISEIMSDPDDSLKLTVSTTKSIKRTYDGGESWKTLFEGYYFRDIEKHPENADIIYVSTMDYYETTYWFRSTDDGESWEKIRTLDQVVRSRFAVTPDKPERIYAITADNVPGKMHDITFSDDTGKTFKNLSSHIDTLDLVYAQGFYNLTLSVDPFDHNRIIAGGVMLYMTSDGGRSWVSMQDGIHYDHHHAEYNYADSCMYLCNDGGLTRLNNYRKNAKNYVPDYTDLSTGLGITQFYRLGLNKYNDSLFFAGSQDNGTFKYDYGEFSHSRAGDGMEIFVGNKNQNIVYTSDQLGNIWKSQNMGYFYENSFRFHWQESKTWLRHYDMNPFDDHSLIMGLRNVWRTFNGHYWSKITDFDYRKKITAIRYHPADSNIIIAAKTDRIYRSKDGGMSFDSLFSVEPAVSDIRPYQFNENDFLASCSGYIEGKKVYGYINDELINLSYDLPNVPVNSIVRNKLNGDIFVGTDIGVFKMDQEEGSWKRFGSSLPNVIVNDLNIHYGSGFLYAATFGRGIWRMNLYDCNITRPKLLSSGKIEICSDSLYTLSAEKIGIDGNFRWSTGDTTESIQINRTGDYYISHILDSCISTSGKISVKAFEKPKLNLFLMTGNPVCRGDSVVVRSEIEFDNSFYKTPYEYKWSNGKKGKRASFKESGKYFLKIENDAGCVVRSDTFEVAINENPPKPEIKREGNYLTTNESDLISWYLDGEIVKETGENFLRIPGEGEYFAEVYNKNRCSNVSDAFEIEFDNESNMLVKIYPNPASNNVEIEMLIQSKSDVKIKIYNSAGMKVFDEKYENSRKYFSTELNLRKYAAGAYYMEVNSKDKRTVKNLIIKNE